MGKKNIQAAAYNGARTVFQVVPLQTKRSPGRLIIIQPDPDNLSVYSLPHQISKKIKNTMLFACQSQNFELKKRVKNTKSAA